MQKQKGFVQGALLIGIALLAIVIGAFAMASNNNTSDISKEKAKTNAAVAVKKFADAYEAYQIKAAQESLLAADTALTATPALPMPTSITNAAYTGDLSGSGDSSLTVKVDDIVTCAQVNRVLGLTTSSEDGAAVQAANSANEGCVTSSQGFTYYRNFRGNERFYVSGGAVPA